ncbi:MucR family transcriptional regulator [uncultured Pseudodesulfovibrio sp.]|uniref:MucR family transcriptional regulator n=1 Tax=uncultured Pseudodesulfovibrio sp. TaxID=2035858 RepID=UPI0037494DD2
MAHGEVVLTRQVPHVDPKRAIRNKSIVCLECGRTFKTLSKRHLESHGLTPDEYRAKWGYKKRAPLSCRETAKARSERMKEMKLWTRTGKKPDDKKKPAKAAGKDAAKDA